MRRLILQYIKSVRNVPGEHEYVVLNRPKKELADLYIIHEVLDSLLGQVEWAEIDIFADMFHGFANDCVSLDKLNNRYYMSYSFEHMPYSQDFSFSVQEFKNLLIDWNRLLTSNPNYIVLYQSEDNKFLLEGKNALSDDEIGLIV